MSASLALTPCRAVAAALLALALGAGARAQDPFDPGTTDGLFSLPRSQDDIATLQEARSAIAERDYTLAVERLNRLLRDGSRGVLPVLGATGRWTGIRHAVVETLRNLPPAGRESYELLCGREAGRSFVAPLESLAEDELANLAHRFPCTSRGLAARLRLGDLAFVRGEGLVAQTHFRAAADEVRDDDPQRLAIQARNEAADRLVRGALGAPLGDDALATAIGDALTLPGAIGWSAYGGGYDGARPMEAPVGESAEPYGIAIRADGFELNDYPMHATGDLWGIFVNDGHAVRAIDPLGRRLLWEAPGPMVDSDDIGEARGAINPDLVLACALGRDVVVAALQVPNDVIGADRTHSFREAFNILQKIPSRRLFAFDRASGKRLWSHWDYRNGPVANRYRGQDACGAPLVHGDTVYVTTHDQTGAIAFFVTAYDLLTGEVRWRRLVCSSQQEVNMFGNARQEFAAGPIALHRGVIYGTTNLGVCFALDAATGDVRWVAEYPTIPLPRTQLRNQETRPVFFANNPIVITDGVIATTPLDSAFALGIDTETGRVLWQLPYDTRDDTYVRWLLGAIDDEFLFAGLGIVAVRARPETSGRVSARLVASRESLGEEYYRTIAIPRGAVTNDRIWFVGSDGALRILDARGNRDPRMTQMQFGARGNLLMIDGLLTSLADGKLLIWADVDGLIRQARTAMNASSADPLAVLRLATLLRAGGEPPNGAAASALESLYEQGLAAARGLGLGNGSRVLQQLADGLFSLSMERAESVVGRDARAARGLYEQARRRASLPRQWLRAQVALLSIVRDDPAVYLQELQRMADRYPDESYGFDDVGRVPIVVYALWQSIELAIDGPGSGTPGDAFDPRIAVRTCQRLIDRYRDVPIGELDAGARALLGLRTLVARHGPEVIAELEEVARGELAAAGEDLDALRRIRERFPLTQAATTAGIRMLDISLARRDFATAIATLRILAHDDSPTPSMQRRATEAARGGGNPALAHALAWRLIASAGSLASDYPPDGGRTYAQVLGSITAPVEDVGRLPALPVDVIAQIDAPNLQSSFGYVPVHVASGFSLAGTLPLYATFGDTQLFGFDLEAPRFDATDRRLITTLDGRVDELLVCGAITIGVDSSRAFGIDRAERRLAWEFKPEAKRGLISLGVQSGVLHLFGYDPTSHGDGGTVFGVEPITGSVIFERALDPHRVATPPVACADALWLLDTRERSQPVLRALSPLDGSVVESTPVPAEALRFLALDGRLATRLDDPNVQTGFFADSRLVYLPVDLSSADEPSRIVALERGSGEIAWRWAGLPGCSIQRAGLRGDQVIVFEKDVIHARVSILDTMGQPVVPPFEFQRLAMMRNWDRSAYPMPVPSPLLIADFEDQPRLTCISLVPDGPRFLVALENVGRVLREPVVGDGYLAVPYSRQGRTEPTVEVLDLFTRAGALPDGQRTLTLKLTAPLRMAVHGAFLIVETRENLRVLGVRK